MNHPILAFNSFFVSVTVMSTCLNTLFAPRKNVLYRSQDQPPPDNFRLLILVVTVPFQILTHQKTVNSIKFWFHKALKSGQMDSGSTGKKVAIRKKTSHRFEEINERMGKTSRISQLPFPVSSLLSLFTSIAPCHHPITYRVAVISVRLLLLCKEWYI